MQSPFTEGLQYHIPNFGAYAFQNCKLFSTPLQEITVTWVKTLLLNFTFTFNKN